MYNKMKENIFYIYCHRKKTDGKCFYIGKGKENRYQSKSGRNQYWWNIVNKHGFETEILVNNLSEQKAFELESYFCTQIGYENLCNIRTENGWGGYTMSESTKEKLSNTLTGRKNPWVTQHLKGKKQPEGTGEKKSKALKGKPKPEGFGDMMREVRKGVPKPEGMGARISEKLRGKPSKKAKTVQQFDLDGNFIAEYPNTMIAAEKTKSNCSTISKVCRGIFSQTNGFIWKYK
jgi:hypothetical protein